MYNFPVANAFVLYTSADDPIVVRGLDEIVRKVATSGVDTLMYEMYDWLMKSKGAVEA